MPTSRRLHTVGKRYSRGGPFVLRQVDATLAAGDLVHVGGSNGSGKSTLLRVIAGVTSAIRGRVEGRRRSVGFVPERFPPSVRFTARDYLRHLAAVRGVPAGDGIEVLTRLGGGDYVDTPMTELSKGSCQKVALALGLTGPPGLLVLDEAWTGLDAAAQTVLTAEVHARADAGAIVVLTDHVPRPSAVRPTTRWWVADGTLALAPLAADRQPVTTVVLSGSGTGEGLRSHPGVVACERQPGRLTLAVGSDSCDALLEAALRNGWSVREVRPAR